MKHYLFILLLLAFSIIGFSQTLYNNSGTVSIGSGATLYVSGAVSNASGSTISNNGTLRITGNIINNGTMSAPATSTLSLQGTTAQTFSGASSIAAKNVLVNNAAGITFNTTLQVDGAITFTAGVLTASSSSTPVIFTSNSSVSGTPTDASHINGYVRKLGTGAFTFPVGSATKYQPVGVNLSANAAGLTAFYNASDAGSGTFTTGGTQAVALVSYNSGEYWDLTPVSTATGTVTLYWDGVNESGSYAVANRRIAHKVGGNWLNEGGIGTGTSSAGSITSNAVSNWSPFANGSLSFPLPVKWLHVSASLNNIGQAQITWQVEESDIKAYTIERSIDNKTFIVAGEINSKGNGFNAYSFTEVTPLKVTAYYRIKQMSYNGKLSYSETLRLSGSGATSMSLYPNPFNTTITVSSNIVQTARLLDALGRLVQTLTLKAGVTNINTKSLSKGIYTLYTENGRSIKLVKE